MANTTVSGEGGERGRLYRRAAASLSGFLNVFGRAGRTRRREVERFSLETREFVWALGSYCALHRKPFDPNLLLQQHPAPHSSDSLIHAARALGFRIQQRRRAPDALGSLAMPCLVVLKAAREDSRDSKELSTGDTAARSESLGRLALLCQISSSEVGLFYAGSNTPTPCPRAEFDSLYVGTVFMVAGMPPAVSDPDAVRARPRQFGFRWFVPELLKHRRVWRDVLAASLVIQLLALATPLFTQVVVDKVVTHRSHSTLMVIAIGMAIFLVFSSLLTWVRQYLVLHTGNRVDAVLGSAVFEHLLKLPPRYFEQRPTGVITARLRGVENIREFIASAAVTLMLDLPFLFIFIAVMFDYSVLLTLITLGLIGLIVLMSLFVAPIFRERLNEQFLIGARNQAFTTEYVAGMETVKSLQMEPLLRNRYGDYLAQYLGSGFGVRQIANTYNVLAGGIDQLTTLLILAVGAYLVMNGTDFTIGMLVAYQMFASRVSQPLLRLVGLWQQFQQASLSVARLGDIMNAPPEPYTLEVHRTRQVRGLLEIEKISFRYADTLPYLYQDFSFTIEPGKIVALMGASGSGKSTLAKLLQGFYLPGSGQIKIDGHDLRHLSANQLRSNFGVVPQETMLFSGTIYDNLLMANPMASFEQIVEACKVAEIHGVIEELPQGYRTEIGERGVGLSTGQKQRIAIARALLKRPPVLIFDEATTSLDQPTAEHFCTTINQLKGRATILFITHALPKTLQVDEIVHIGTAPPVPKADARLAAL
jgi:ATP-binding cassette, subfamily B, bacterial HlyB/CyaB